MAINLKLTAILSVVVIAHIFISPYSKVEESFNMQAIHDHLVYTPKSLEKVGN